MFSLNLTGLNIAKNTLTLRPFAFLSQTVADYLKNNIPPQIQHQIHYVHQNRLVVSIFRTTELIVILTKGQRFPREILSLYIYIKIQIPMTTLQHQAPFYSY